MPQPNTDAMSDRAQSLRSRFQATAKRIHDDNVPLGEAVDRFVERLLAANAGEGAPKAGEQFPDFLLPDIHGHLTTRAEALAEQAAIIVFLRGHWCPYCRDYSHELNALVSEVGAGKVRLIFVTPEQARYAINYDPQSPPLVLIDMGAAFALSLGLGVWVDDILADLLLQDGDLIPEYNNDPGWILPIPATFVLDNKGIVRAAHIDPDYRTRMDLEALALAVNSLAEGQT